MRARRWLIVIAAAVAGCGSNDSGSSSGSASVAPGSTTPTSVTSGSSATPTPQLAVSGGISALNTIQPLVFAWARSMTVAGDGFQPAEAVAVSIFGPTNSIGVVATSVPLGTVNADATGHFSTSMMIPYDGGVVGPAARIPRPGAYRVQASSIQAGTVAAVDTICVCPESDPKLIDWGHERGGRYGNLPAPFHDMSPERIDPEWVSVWDETPVGAYGSVDESHASSSDYPGSHYVHDFCFSLLPDADYRWLIGTHNYEDEGAEIEVEWERQNAGSTASYSRGQIGLPTWAWPTDGDRVYVVGRWILDCGHPDDGCGTEIHPPRLLATMRRHPSVDASGRPVSQVDVFVSGHAGGANRFPDGLSAALAQNGHGGGRVSDLGPSNAATYWQSGPVTTAERIALGPLGIAAGFSASNVATWLGSLGSSAGPSAFGWLPTPNEARPIDDRDYEFDVPLPPQPAGATSAPVEVVRRAEDTTVVSEVITFPDYPRSAHVLLPFRGKGSGVYARTILFGSAAPAARYHVRLVEVQAIDLPGAWQLVADVCGQWVDLSAKYPAFGQVANGQVVSTGADFDVYAGPQDDLRIHLMGYRAQPLDAFFGHMFGLSCYQQMLGIGAMAAVTKTRDNDDLGDVELVLAAPLPTAATTQTVAATKGNQPGAFKVVILVEPK